MTVRIGVGNYRVSALTPRAAKDAVAIHRIGVSTVIAVFEGTGVARKLMRVVEVLARVSLVVSCVRTPVKTCTLRTGAGALLKAKGEPEPLVDMAGGSSETPARVVKEGVTHAIANASTLAAVIMVEVGPATTLYGTSVVIAGLETRPKGAKIAVLARLSKGQAALEGARGAKKGVTRDTLQRRGVVAKA